MREEGREQRKGGEEGRRGREQRKGAEEGRRGGEGIAWKIDGECNERKAAPTAQSDLR